METQSLASQTQAALAQVLNDLQTATLMASALERQLLEAGTTIQQLAQTVERLSATQNLAALPNLTMPPSTPTRPAHLTSRRSLLLD
jgi:hypothetical protein